MACSAITTGFPGPNFVVELGNRDAILPGTFEIEQGARWAVSSKSIRNLTLSAAAAALDSATLSQTIAALTLSAAGGTTVSASLSATLADLTLSAAANVVDDLSLSGTIADLTLSATVAVTDSASLAATIDPLTLTATAAVIVSASVDATLGDVILSATADGAAARSRDGIYPWWWRAYCDRIYAERRAEEKARCERERWLAENAVEGDGYATAPAPVAQGAAEHVLPPEDEIAALTAVWILLTDGVPDELADDVAEFWDPSDAVPTHPDDEAAIATAAREGTRKCLMTTRRFSPWPRIAPSRVRRRRPMTYGWRSTSSSVPRSAGSTKSTKFSTRWASGSPRSRPGPRRPSAARIIKHVRGSDGQITKSILVSDGQ
jgi:hypothetical protein